jgi:hypothetical protein
MPRPCVKMCSDVIEFRAHVIEKLRCVTDGTPRSHSSMMISKVLVLRQRGESIIARSTEAGSEKAIVFGLRITLRKTVS